MRTLFLTLLVVMSFSAGAAACEGRLVSENIRGAPVCIPAQAQRIVVLDPLLSLGVLLELDVDVIAAPLMGIQDAEIRAEAQRRGIADIGHMLEPSLERITALKPDLIIGSSDLHGQVHAQVSRIAPSVLIDLVDWKRHVRLLADVTDRTAVAEEKLAEYDRRVATLRPRVKDVTVSMVRLAPNGFQVYLDGPGAYAPYAVLAEAGVRRPAYETTTGGEMVKRPDWEGLGELTGDILLYVVVSGYDTAPDDALAAEVTANPLWQMLPAVAAGRVHRIDRATWMGFYGIAAAHRVLDDVERYIAKAP